MRCKLDARGAALRDLERSTNALAFVTSGLAADAPTRDYVLRCATRLVPAAAGGPVAGTLAGAIEIGDAGVAVDENAVWRAFSAATAARAAWDRARSDAFEAWDAPPRAPPAAYAVERVTCAAFSLFPLSLAPDARARAKLARAVEDPATPRSLKVLVSILAAFPRLSIADAELHFDAHDLAPRRSATASAVAVMIGDAYRTQLRQRWWSLASSLSLEAPARRRRPPAAARAPARAPARPPPPAAGEFDAVVDAPGPLGLVVAWGPDGSPSIAKRKPVPSGDVARALDAVRAGDALTAIDGAPAASLTADELVAAMTKRPVSLRLWRPTAPAPDYAAEAAASDAAQAASRAAAAPTIVELTIPATERLLGFSVGVRPTPAGDRLVVTAVRDLSVLAARGVPLGARLIELNGEDVAALSLDDLTARARSLASTERVIKLAIDPPP